MSDVERLSFELAKQSYDKFRTVKKRFKLTYGELLALMIERTDFDKLANEASEIRTARLKEDQRISEIASKLKGMSKSKVDKLIGQLND
jgi:hypothetical protein